ncbi:hypothetical protein H3146_21905 [Streptomyces sp. OF3]|uniref:Restriction endonuclease type IV Mrr domain-containing protein n=1 Tax=Streptomyces alkaliterrae TaxID=2213162 RepID=A0A7W3WPA4_9ACTN|nr:hypothetical protein [Streptomyces alkaliterrae]MBB1255993.1 hypothetical protein [Streptomyces alkaliterrae]
MTENATVRCPDCRREHHYNPTNYPCPCGTPVSLTLASDQSPVPVLRRNWSDCWVSVRCVGCGRVDNWPQPELGCPCGTLLRLPVRGRQAPAGAEPSASPTGRATDAHRPAFQPVTIRTAHDALLAADQYLRWLGHRDVRAAGSRPASGVDLRGHDIVARVEAGTAPTTVRAVETIWLNGLSESTTAACFSLAGYAPRARARADELGLALFVLDLTGTPQAVNEAAERLVRGET